MSFQTVGLMDHQFSVLQSFKGEAGEEGVNRSLAGERVGRGSLGQESMGEQAALWK